MGHTDQPLVSTLDQFRLVRQQIEHEDNLISQRLSWLLGSQSFLFTAYAISLNGPAQMHSRSFESTVALLIVLLPLVAIISAMLIWVAVLAGVWTMYKLRHAFQRKFLAEFQADVPPVQSTGGALIMGHFAPVFLPPLFLVVWLLLMIRS